MGPGDFLRENQLSTTQTQGYETHEWRVIPRPPRPTNGVIICPAITDAQFKYFLAVASPGKYSTMSDRKEIRVKVLETSAAETGSPEGSITLNSRFDADPLARDEFARLKLASTLEHDFDVKLTEGDVQNAQTIAEFADVILRAQLVKCGKLRPRKP